MDKERLNQLADMIEKQPHCINHQDKDGFGMNYYFHACGTPSCIAGFAVAMFAPEIADTDDLPPSKTVRIASDLLLINRNDAQRLFTLNNDMDDLNGNRHYEFAAKIDWTYITPTVAAQCIRNFVQFGKVDWLRAFLDAGVPLNDSFKPLIAEYHKEEQHV